MTAFEAVSGICVGDICADSEFFGGLANENSELGCVTVRVELMTSGGRALAFGKGALDAPVASGELAATGAAGQ